MPNLTQNLKTLDGDEQSRPTHPGCGHPSHVPASDWNLFINIITYQQRVSMGTPVATNTKISSQNCIKNLFWWLFILAVHELLQPCGVESLTPAISISIHKCNYDYDFSSTSWSYIQMYRVISILLSEMTDTSISNAMQFTLIQPELNQRYLELSQHWAHQNIMQLNPLSICSLI